MFNLIQMAALLYRFSADAQVPVPVECAREVGYFQLVTSDGQWAEGPESLCAVGYFEDAAAAEDGLSACGGGI